MLKNMKENKTFKYLSRNDHLNNKKELLKFLKQRYTNYRNQWREAIQNLQLITSWFSIKILKKVI